ncbi:MAG: hypothetical protein EA400_00315 [Chromatiaceae bacterium]|nr:MAG: hypothetical protein EA400_00315 [Chromatiaceae bacterium]
MTPRAQWNALSPAAKRAAVIGLASAALLAFAGLSMMVSPPRRIDADTAHQEALSRNILTDANMRALGLEALAARLDETNRRLDRVQRDAERGPRHAAQEPPEPAPEIVAQLRDLELTVATLREELEVTRGRAAEPPPAPLVQQPPPAVATTTVPAPPAAPPPTRRSDPGAPMQELFAPPDPAISTLPAPSPEASAARPARTLTIRSVTQTTETPEALAEAGSGTRRHHPDAIFIPAGTILSGVLLNGLDAPTAQSARQNPTPALARLKDLAILPNRVRTDIRECFVLVSGYGDLAAERVYLRGETLSCVRADGGVIEVALDSYTVGEDGKVGMRGRLVSKQGAVLAKALQAGFLQAFSSVFTAVPAIGITTNDPTVGWQSQLDGRAFGTATARGAGSALDRLANYYMDMAEQMFPVLEVDAGRGVDLILSRGVSLRLIR